MDSQIIIHRENFENLPCRFKKKIESDIAYLIKAGIPGLKGVYLFGSCARGDLRNGSDVDLLILTEEKMEDRMMAADIRWTLDEEIDGVRTDIVYMNEKSIQESSAFKNLVNRDKKIVLEVLG